MKDSSTQIINHKILVDTKYQVIHNVYPDGLDYPKHMLDPNIGGLKKKCRHIYEYVNQDICPFCGRDTHEPDYKLQSRLHREWMEDGKNKEFICPQGGTMIGAWDI